MIGGGRLCQQEQMCSEHPQASCIFATLASAPINSGSQLVVVVVVVAAVAARLVSSVHLKSSVTLAWPGRLNLQAASEEAMVHLVTKSF